MQKTATDIQLSGPLSGPSSSITTPVRVFSLARNSSAAGIPWAQITRPPLSSTGQAHVLQLQFVAPASRSIGVARPPIPQDQRRAQEVGIEGVGVPLSVALCHRPVNHFQPEAFSEFRNGNSRRSSQRQVQNILIRVHLFRSSVAAGLPDRRAPRKNQFAENSSHDNPAGKLDVMAAARSAREVNHLFDVVRAQLSPVPPHYFIKTAD